MARSLIEICLIFGYNVKFAGPKNYFFDDLSIKKFEQLKSKHGGQLLLTNNPIEAVQHSNFIYTDTFVSMGEEDVYDEKIEAFKNFQVNKKLMQESDNAYFMHCLPAHRNIEVTDEVIDSKKSLVYIQAKNRMLTSLGVFSYFCS